MNPRVQYLIDKSERGLKASRMHLTAGDYDFSVSRAYYSMFHMVEALLLTQNHAASKHSGLISAFAERFVKTGLVERSLHQSLHRAFELRQKGDYWSEDVVSLQMAFELCDVAQVFGSTLKELIAK